MTPRLWKWVEPVGYLLIVSFGLLVLFWAYQDAWFASSERLAPLTEEDLENPFWRLRAWLL